MMQNHVLRFFHSGVSCWSSSQNKSLLSKLRKKTGFTFSNCRKALEVNDNNLEKAEKWLQEQAQALGWSKLSKLEGRVTAQGMVGIAMDGSGRNAAMIEVNCETDFVARNKHFREMINMVSSSCLQHAKLSNNKAGPICKELLDSEQMKCLTAPDGKPLADHVALLVSSVGENVSLRRAVCVGVREPTYHLAGYAHPGNAEETNVMAGKYGALLMYEALKTNLTTQHTSRQLCQHVVGMNPKTIEKEETEANTNVPGDVAANKPSAAVDQKTAESQPEADHDAEFTNDSDIENNEETAMLSQDFLLDPSVTVKQVTSEAGITVHDFIRFETGEKVQEEVKQDPEPRAQQMRG
ncbi:elongation factor Ts, mitochondrial [Nilaparvata lugens]|uniref:elongation factor Ts, mitochondrial n=2 Tax=Nilaparvata lugens TaxID=108931 RepID=UPI00193E089B|nr:elongation factor Ts, mitochondrial [Nilaparvata lugens]